MPDPQFTEKGHIYMIRGRRVPCVSDLCRFIHREIYHDAPPWQMELAADRGTAVHAATQRLDETGTAQIEESYAPYLQAYATFLRDHVPAWQLIEKPLYSAADDFAGTVDRYGIMAGKSTLLDIKTTYTVYKPLCSASLNLYRRLLLHNGYHVEQQLILHLRKDGTYKLIPFEENDSLSLSLLILHRALEKKRRKEKIHV